MNKRGFKSRLVELDNHVTKLQNEVRSIIGDLDRDLDVQEKTSICPNCHYMSKTILTKGGHITCGKCGTPRIKMKEENEFKDCSCSCHTYGTAKEMCCEECKTKNRR